MQYLRIDRNAYCISINSERYEYLCKNFIASGLNPPKHFNGIRWNAGSNSGCVLSHISLLKTCLFLGLDYCVVYEDDAYPRDNILWWFDKIRKYIPEDWGILKIGNSSYRGEYYPINKYFGYMKSGTAFGSHSYIVRKEVMSDLCMNMCIKWLPDAAMDWCLYLHSKYKPYVVDKTTQFYIQKNITTDNIISKRGGQKYWYPHATKQCGCTSNTPCSGFSPILFEDDKYSDNFSVLCYNNNKISCIIKDGRIDIKGLTGKFEKESDEIYYALWDNDTYSTLKLKKIINGVCYYDVLTKENT